MNVLMLNTILYDTRFTERGWVVQNSDQSINDVT
jgi:hypothetical protein